MASGASKADLVGISLTINVIPRYAIVRVSDFNESPSGEASTIDLIAVSTHEFGNLKTVFAHSIILAFGCSRTRKHIQYHAMKRPRFALAPY